MNRLERKILGILRRHRWLGFRLLSMAGTIRGSKSAFREVTIALINLEQGGYIGWRDKSSLKRITVLRKAYGIKLLFPYFYRRPQKNRSNLHFTTSIETQVQKERNLRVKNRSSQVSQSIRAKKVD
ncbi:hypothetical protein [Saccharibacillus sp. JS10]|uniref:hypothetical protein n=1 Tax=Saccharibacillus sp. JS10 TaxID=2950552 RepID=UPI00210EC6B7|nr:hypothetical protein [Saccharibacillus sp. JS10]MCQ4085615.1 hypothetical protein [Saccharibacillus sp. JS10]